MRYFYGIIMRPSSVGGAAYCVAFCLSICLSVCLSVRPVPSVTWRHLANYNDTCIFRQALRHPYFSARTEGRISYGHLGRTNSCYYRVLRAMLSASRRQPRLLHVSEVDRRQTWSIGQELTMCDIVWVSPQSHSSLPGSRSATTKVELT